MKIEETFPTVTVIFCFSSYLETPCHPKRQRMTQKSHPANKVEQVFLDAINMVKNEESKFIKLQYSIQKCFSTLNETSSGTV